MRAVESALGEIHADPAVLQIHVDSAIRSGVVLSVAVLAVGVVVPLCCDVQNTFLLHQPAGGAHLNSVLGVLHVLVDLFAVRALLKAFLKHLEINLVLEVRGVI